MNLRSFLATLPRGGVAEFARKVGITPVYLSQLSSSQDGREPSPELCVVIERESNGAVRRWDLRPQDWPLIWPELIAKKGAPGKDEPADTKGASANHDHPNGAAKALTRERDIRREAKSKDRDRTAADRRRRSSGKPSNPRR